MESDDLKHIVPRKRSRSPSEVPQTTLGASSNAADASTAMQFDQADAQTWQSRQPKRQRKNKNVPSYDAPVDKHVLEQMGRSNPLSRKALKKDAKRARKAHRTTTEAADPGAGGMDVDDDGLQFTFIA